MISLIYSVMSMLSKPQAAPVCPCSCRHLDRCDTTMDANNNCPLDSGLCESEKSIVYGATVTRLDTGVSTSYCGMSGGLWKSRWRSHNGNFRHSDQRTTTTLAGHIWSLKDEDIPFHTDTATVTLQLILVKM